MPLEVRVVDNPVAQRVLAVLRDRGTPPRVFREALELAGLFLGYEIGRGLPVREKVVETPLSRARAVEPLDERVVVVGVIRAALPMVAGILRVLWNARAGFIAARRREDGGGVSVEVGYTSIPVVEDAIVVLVDPMLATASTLLEATEKVLGLRPVKLYYATLIASKPGIERLREGLAGLEAVLYTFAVDPVLNSRGFIVPGLGDAGDRAFNT